MAIDPSILEKNVKASFSKARAHMDGIENELNSQKNQLNELKELIKSLNSKLSSIYSSLEHKKPVLDNKKISSTGNKGVVSLTHSLNNHSLTQQNLKKDLLETFQRLTKQEFMVFLTIYQLEEENGPISYQALAQKLELSEACIRSYVSRLIRLNLPLEKIKRNNKVVYLSLSKNFRDLNLKDKLTQLYYQNQDPSQMLLNKYH